MIALKKILAIAVMNGQGPVPNVGSSARNESGD